MNLLFAPSHDKDSEMARFNEELIAQRIAEIRQAMALLEPYAQMSQQQFLTNREAVDAAKYRLLMGVESCAQVSSHLFSRLKGQALDSIPSCFEQLSGSEWCLRGWRRGWCRWRVSATCWFTAIRWWMTSVSTRLCNRAYKTGKHLSTAFKCL